MRDPIDAPGRPLTTVIELVASPRLSSSVICRPYAETRRVPTTAIDPSSRSSIVPCTKSTRGVVDLFQAWRITGVVPDEGLDLRAVDRLQLLIGIDLGT